MVLLSIGLFVLGIIILVKSSNEAVSRSVHVSKITGISHMAIGFIILAVGTSIPELTVSIISSLEGATPLALGTLIGSSISDMILIFGISALIFTIKLTKKDVQVTETLLLSSIIVFFILITKGVSFNLALFNILLFCSFAYILVKEKYKFNGSEKPAIPTLELLKHAAVLIISIVLIIISAKIIVDSSIDMSRFFGVSETIIGLLVVGVGSTLPELAVSITAIKKGKEKIAVGTVIGSVMVNIGLILGIVGIISPFTINFIEVLSLLSLLAIIGFFLFLVSRGKFGRAEGLLLITIYIIFIIMIVKAELIAGFVNSFMVA